MTIMLIKYITSLLINSHSQIECPPIMHDSPVGLSKDGLVSIDKADIILKIDSHDELVVIKTNQKQVKLERCGRSMLLKPEHPVRICEKDCLFIDDTTIYISKSTYLTVKPKRFPKTIQQTKRFLVSSSMALCSFVAINACDDLDAYSTSGSAPQHVECNVDEYKCEDNVVFRCKHYSWDRVEDCGEDICKSNNETAYCEPKTTGGEPAMEVCQNGNRKCGEGNAVYECKSNMWQKVEDCGEDSCKFDNETAYCEPNTTGGEPAMEVCQNGNWKCQDNAVYECNNYEWSLIEQCDDSNPCEEYEDNFAACKGKDIAEE